MAVSRSAIEYLERAGLVESSWVARPRLDVSSLLVHGIPLGRPDPKQSFLEGYEGRPRPDRGSARPWPNQAEE